MIKDLMNLSEEELEERLEESIKRELKTPKTSRRNVGKKFLRKKKDNRENSSKSDGIHLDLGSSEYRERVRDLQNIDEKKQEDVKLKEKGLREMDDIQEFSKDQADYREKMAKEPEVMSLSREQKDNMRLSSTERVVSNQILKSTQRDNVVHKASQEAAKTETLEDDKFVKRRLPKMIDESVYNEGESLDDFYPGQSTLEKYM